MMLGYLRIWDARLKALLDFYICQDLDTLAKFVMRIEQNNYPIQSFLVSAFVFLRALVCSVHGSPDFLLSETTGSVCQHLTAVQNLSFSYPLEMEKTITASANYNDKAKEQVELIRAEVLNETAQELQDFEEEFQESLLGLQL